MGHHLLPRVHSSRKQELEAEAGTRCKHSTMGCRPLYPVSELLHQTFSWYLCLDEALRSTMKLDGDALGSQQLE